MGRRGISWFVVALVGVIILSAVALSVVRRERAMVQRPDDLRVEYHWSAGALPPPYHYEYEVIIGPGAQGEIVFRPDYAQHEAPVWQEAFAVSEADLDALYGLLRRGGVLRGRWRQRPSMAVGGSSEWLHVTAYGERTTVPASIHDDGTMAEVYDMVRGLVPAAIWDDLMARRERFELEYDSE
jgi:hypothetical protein